MSAARQIILNTSIVNKLQNMQFSSSPFFFLREGTFFLGWGGGGGGLGPQRGGSSVKVSTKGGGPYPLFQLFKGRVTPFPEFLMGIFVMLFSIFL